MPNVNAPPPDPNRIANATGTGGSVPGERLSWIDALGTEHALDDLLDGPTGKFLVLEREAFDMPKYRFIEQDVPLFNGNRFRYALAAPRDPILGLLVQGDSEADLAVQTRLLERWFAPALGPGWLRNYAPDGTVRDLACRYYDGLPGVEDDQHRYPGAMQYVLQWHANDPYWYDANAQTFSFGTGASVTFLGTPFLPLNISQSGVSSGFSISNDGDDIAYPIWQITGPGVSPVLTNSTTGQTLSLTGSGGLTLTAGQVLTIDTTFGNSSVTLADGTNCYKYVSNTSALWTLAQGFNSLSLGMTGTTSASMITLSYKRRWLGV